MFSDSYFSDIWPGFTLYFKRAKFDYSSALPRTSQFGNSALQSPCVDRDVFTCDLLLADKINYLMLLLSIQWIGRWDVSFHGLDSDTSNQYFFSPQVDICLLQSYLSWESLEVSIGDCHCSNQWLDGRFTDVLIDCSQYSAVKTCPI